MVRNFLLIALSLWYMTAKSQDHTFSQNVSSFTINAPQLSGERKIWIYLPFNYKETDKKFPVIYMHDGQNLFDSFTSFAGEWRIDEVLDSLKAESIVIGIENGGDKRINELTPYTNEKYGGGDGDKYLDFLVNTLKPYVDENYHTLTDRSNTTIFGSSLGGLISFYAILKYPKVFGKAGVFSPSFWFSEDMYDLVHNTETIDARIYFMAGDHESSETITDLERMEELVKHKIKDKKQFRKKIVHNGRHNETLWTNEFEDAYLWLTAND